MNKFICIILLFTVIEYSSANINALLLGNSVRTSNILAESSRLRDEMKTNEYSKRDFEIGTRRFTRETFGPTTGNIIKIGRTYAQSGAEVPYSTSQDAYLQMIFGYINNVLGGIVIGGIKRNITQFVYDDASNCEDVTILYEHAILVDGVDGLIGPIADTCEGASIMAEKYQVPMVNAGNYNTRFDYPNGLNWTFTINTNPFNLAKGCIDQFANAGALTAVVAGTEILQAAFGTSTNFTLGTEKVPIHVLDYVVLDQSLLDDNKTSDDYMTPYFQKWQSINNGTGPDIFIGGAGDTAGTINFLQSAANNFFGSKVKGQYHWLGPNIAETRAQLSWTGYGLTIGSGFDSSSFNFSDPILGNSQVYVDLFRETFGAEASYFDASNVAAPIVLLRSMQNAGSLNKTEVRESLLHFNESTILGLMTMGPDGYLEDVPNYCFQVSNNGSYHPLYDPNQFNLANSVSLEYPYIPSYPPGFGQKPSWFDKNKDWLLPVAILVPLAILAVGILIFVLYKKYYLVFIEKNENMSTDGSWDA